MFQRIPQAFVKHFDGKIPRKCLFCSPTERFWQVDVGNSNNRLCFKKGWKEFVQDHGLELGDFLVFHYLGYSEFYVEIYGKNCCQKSSSAVTSARRISSKTNATIDSRTNPVKVEVVDLDELCDRGRGHSQSRRGKFLLMFYRDVSVPHYVFKISTAFWKISAFLVLKSLSGSKGKACRGGIGAIRAADKYVRNHPSFKCVMRAAYVGHGYLVQTYNRYKFLSFFSPSS